MVIKMDKKSAEDHFNDGIKFKQNKKFNEIGRAHVRTPVTA